MFVLVLDWTQCLPQGVGSPPAMLRGRTAGFPKILGGRASGEAEIDGYNLHSSPDWRTNHVQAVPVWCDYTVHPTNLIHVNLLDREHGIIDEDSWE